MLSITQLMSISWNLSTDLIALILWIILNPQVSEWYWGVLGDPTPVLSQLRTRIKKRLLGAK